MSSLSQAGIESMINSLRHWQSGRRVASFGLAGPPTVSQMLQPNLAPYMSAPSTTTHGHHTKGEVMSTKQAFKLNDSEGDDSDDSRSSRSSSLSTDSAFRKEVHPPVAVMPPQFAHMFKTDDKEQSPGQAKGGDDDEPHYYCLWCSDQERGIVLPLTRMPDADRHVQQFHIDEGLLWEAGGLIRCKFGKESYRGPKCPFVVPHEGYNTVKDHIAREQCLPLLPAREASQYVTKDKRKKSGKSNDVVRQKIDPHKVVNIQGEDFFYCQTANHRADEGEREHAWSKGGQARIKRRLARWYRRNSHR